jgi:hypothetical protein
MVVMMNFGFHTRASRSGPVCPEFLLRVPRPSASSLTSAKTPTTPVLDVMGSGGLCTTTFVALGVVCLPQRSQGGGSRPGDMSGGRYTAAKAERTAPMAERAADNAEFSA